MTAQPCFTTRAGDTPLRTVPEDYDGGGVGRWFVLPDGPDAGRRLYFWERRHGDDGDGPVVLLVHGNPECSYTYRHVAAELEQRSLPPGTRVVAMDHLGFGRSDQASFEMVEMHHAHNLRRLVEALDLRDITLVLHDWGGPIGIGAFLDEPERVANLVLLNTTVFPVPTRGRTYASYPIPFVLPWSRTARLVPDRLWGAHAALVVGLAPTHAPGMLAAWGSASVRSLRPRRGPAGAGSVFREQFGSRLNARSSKRMVRQTPVWGHGYVYDDERHGTQDNRSFYRAVQELVPTAWGRPDRGVGAAGLFGAWDPLAEPEVLAQWRAALPQLDGHLQVFEGVSHFVEEHRGGQIADEVVRLLGAP